MAYNNVININILYINKQKNILDFNVRKTYTRLYKHISWNHKNINLGLVQNPSLREDLKKSKLGLELLMFYYV